MSKMGFGKFHMRISIKPKRSSFRYRFEYHLTNTLTAAPTRRLEMPWRLVVPIHKEVVHFKWTMGKSNRCCADALGAAVSQIGGTRLPKRKSLTRIRTMHPLTWGSCGAPNLKLQSPTTHSTGSKGRSPLKLLLTIHSCGNVTCPWKAPCRSGVWYRYMHPEIRTTATAQPAPSNFIPFHSPDRNLA